MKITAAIITLNEQANIDPCLESLNWVDEIVLIDGGSEDKTLEKAKAHHANIDVIPFKDFSSQKNEALKRATGDWVFFIDADERVPSGLAREVRQLIDSGAEPSAYAIKRETTFFERRLRFSGTQDDYPVRLWPRGEAHFEQPVHEKVITKLPIKKLENSMLHYSTQNLRHYNQKLDRYMPYELQILKRRRSEVGVGDYTLRPIAKFFFIYFYKLGFLDGLTGLQFAYLAAYYDFLKFFNFKKILDSEILGNTDDPITN